MAIQSKKILVSVPEPLLKKLDRAARQENRNRSAELCVRLADSLKGKKVPERSGAAA